MLREAGVLVPAKLALKKTEDAEQQNAVGFAVVDFHKVNQLDEHTRTVWNNLGLTRLIEMHLNSIAALMPVPKQ